MPRIDHVVCPVDLTDASARALAYGVKWARWYGASLDIVHVAPLQVAAAPLGGVAVLIQTRPLAAVRREVETFVTGVVPPDVPFTLDVFEGDPPAHIRQVATRHPRTVIVIGAHERTRLDRFVFGSVAERVVGNAVSPVLLVPPHDARTPEATVACKHIVCAVDLLPSSFEGLRYALSLARESDATLDVLHVVEAEPGNRLTSHYHVPEYLRHRAEIALEMLREHVPDEAREACTIDERVAIGRPVEQILELAGTTDADLVVMGAGDRAHLRSLWLAPTIRNVAQAVHCPVLVVPLPSVLSRTLALGGRQIDPGRWRGFFDELSLRHLGHPATVTVLEPGAAEREIHQLPLLGMTLEGSPRAGIVVMLGGTDAPHLTHTIERPAEVRVEELDTHGLTRLLIRSETGGETLIELPRPRQT
jgi:nucleotide-binding universal stress UspA family protein